MSTIKLNGTTSGSSIIKAPDSGSTNQTFTLPASTGTLAKTSDIPSGITSSADATAITIDSSERVGIGRTSAGSFVDVYNTGNYTGLRVETTVGAEVTCQLKGGGTSSSANVLDIRNGSNGSLFEVRQDGRGLSQFTAKAWVRYGGTSSTIAVADSHNVSSVTHISVGTYQINYANNLANATYIAVGNDDWYGLNYFNLYTTGNVRHTHLNNNWTQRDTGICTALVFGD